MTLDESADGARKSFLGQGEISRSVYLINSFISTNCVLYEHRLKCLLKPPFSDESARGREPRERALLPAVAVVVFCVEQSCSLLLRAHALRSSRRELCDSDRCLFFVVVNDDDLDSS